MSDYPPVRVTNAPGYEDFDGWLMLASGPDWPVNRSIVGFEWEGKRDVAVVPSDCVTPLPTDDDTNGCEGHVDTDDALTSGAGIGEPVTCDGSCNPKRK